MDVKTHRRADMMMLVFALGNFVDESQKQHNCITEEMTASKHSLLHILNMFLCYVL